MDIKQAVDYVGRRFSYTADKKLLIGDVWFVMPESSDGIMRGDCDDFAITSIWLACDRSFLKFIWNVMVLHRYKLYICTTSLGDRHVVGRYRDMWFDNWTKKALPKDQFFEQTGHTDMWPIPLPGPTLIYPLLTGLWYRRRFKS